MHHRSRYTFYFSASNSLMFCRRQVTGLMSCIILKQNPHSYFRRNFQMESHALFAQTHSKAPNGIDIWLSGGLAAYVVFNKGIFHFDSVFASNRITILK